MLGTEQSELPDDAADRGDEDQQDRGRGEREAPAPRGARWKIVEVAVLGSTRRAVPAVDRLRSDRERIGTDRARDLGARKRFGNDGHVLGRAGDLVGRGSAKPDRGPRFVRRELGEQGHLVANGRHHQRSPVTHRRTQTVGELLGVKAQARIGNGRLGEQHVEGPQLGAHGQGRVDAHAQHRLGGVRLEGRRAGRGLEEDQREGVHVALGLRWFTERLFGAEVAHRVVGELFTVQGAQPGERHVSDAHAALVVKEQAARRQGPHHEVVGVQVRERTTDVATQAGGVVSVEQSPRREHVLE